jgi:hypothetical protein
MKHYIKQDCLENFYFPRKKPKIQKFRIFIILVLMISILFVCSCKEQEPIIDNSDYGIFKKDTIELKSFIYKQTILFK